MSKKILLIENDPAFAAELSHALEQTGFDVRVTGDGKEGLDLAREWGPAAIVLCVELPGMSGYLVCQKLRKDDALKGIPLVLTSAEATADTFEKHRALKVRADAYLLKPYSPDALVETLGGLVGLPEGAPAGDGLGDDGAEEELVSLDEEVGLEALPEAEGDLPELDLQSLPEEPAASTSADEALSLLDDAFDGLTAPAGQDALELDAGDEQPPAADDGPLGAELGGEAGDALGALGDDEPLTAAAPAGDDLPGAELDLDRALEEVGSLAPTADPTADLDRELEAVRPPVRGASADRLRAAGIRLLHDDPSGRERDAGAAPADRSEDELRQARARARARDDDDAIRRAEEAEAALSDKDAELAAARSRAESAAAQLRKLEAELDAARAESRRAGEQARAAEGELSGAREKLAAAERRIDELRRRADAATALEHELDELRGELVVARGEADGARGEIERQGAQLQKRVAELEAANAKHEERVLKAYQKIKNDEKVKDKVRKALAIAAQLLEEGLPAETPAEKERRAAAVVGRE
ncbi:response regulator transcription factor [Anaeromyxobacter oryzisoli]|uniref:response regulator transcription factor n=1 Tax=Anaeromyxobacter oryzisoli TaxID=2925408 RepID=UPI001F56994C|nr:response regulator [Anaeromyxobacter sp. SG63]